MKNYLDKLEEFHQYSESYVELLQELKYGDGLYDEKGNYLNEELLKTVRHNLKVLSKEIGVNYQRALDNLEEVEL